jgi:hypothetical protein
VDLLVDAPPAPQLKIPIIYEDESMPPSTNRRVATHGFSAGMLKHWRTFSPPTGLKFCPLARAAGNPDYVADIDLESS